MKQLILIALVLSVLTNCKPKPSAAEQSNSNLYFNGDILSMAGDDPEYFEALVESEGIIVFTGPLDEAKEKYPDALPHDLDGNTLIPGFTDGHSHLAIGMQNIAFADLSSPPVGSIESIADIVQALNDNRASRNIPEGDWVRGWGYDPDQLIEGRHPTKADLDEAFPNHPVFIHHVSGHMGVVNSAALELLKIDENTADPEGGRYVRMEGSMEPNGLVQGNAVKELLFNMPEADAETKEEMFLEIQDYYASCGITTAQDGFSEPDFIDFVQNMDRKGLVKMDIVSQMGYLFAEEYYNKEGFKFREYDGHINVSGIKIVADGSPQGKTAAMSEPYLTEVPGCEKDCKGIPYVSPEELESLMQRAYENNAQLYVHGNGDATIDLIIASLKAVEEKMQMELNDRRTVVIHSQFMRPEQLDEFSNEGIVPSFFTNHTYFWGDVHIENMGEERAFFTSPLKSAFEKGIKFENHTDYMVTPHNQIFTVWTAVNRVSREGVVIGPDERVSPYIALKAITDWGAYMNFEENEKGTLEVGKLADMVILSDNPLKVYPMEIKDIEVTKTIKEGEVIFNK